VDSPPIARLRAFLLLAEELNFTRAAARLHVAQQALSATIRRLEDDVGARLFERSTRAVTLTAAGEALRHHSRRALDELDHGMAEARRADREARGALSLGVMAGAALELTEPILEAFARQHPRATLTLDPHLYDDPSAGLRGGTADVALLRLPLETRELELAHLFTEPRRVAVSSRHPLGRRRSLTLADVHAAVVVRPASPDPLWNDFWAAGAPRTVDARTLEAALELISAGQAIGIAAAGWTRFYPRRGVRALPVDGLPPSQVSLGWRRGQVHPLVPAFVAIALETARALPSRLRAIERATVPRPVRRSARRARGR
jgi:DNA-binding transcriptional LysR family regulator